MTSANTVSHLVSQVYNGPHYDLCPGTAHTMEITMEAGSFGDLTAVRVYRSEDGANWSEVASYAPSALPTSYVSYDVIMRNGLPVKSGPRVYYEVRYYAGTQYLATQQSHYYAVCM